MPKLIDLSGKVFGRLTVLHQAPHLVSPSGVRRVAWTVVCECGTVKDVATVYLVHGDTKSCGCLQPEVASICNTTHGYTTNRRIPKQYHAWAGMIARCYNPNHKGYKDYGARGIGVVDRWRNSYENFISDMGERPDGLTLERINNNAWYGPDNCVWADYFTQARNRRNTIMLTYNGETKPVATWAEELGIPYHTLKYRVFRYGWGVDKAMTEPVKRNNRDTDK